MKVTEDDFGGCHVLYILITIGCSYLIYFLIGKLSYSLSSEPGRTVLLLDVMYTTDPHHSSKSYSPPWAAPFHLFLLGWQYVVLLTFYQCFSAPHRTGMERKK